ncbi:GNAT family N-acetyltransferase [Microbacterium thalassium]|uniref:RimJ/RimL family protein N-acetyltransferase n=1 Tax=Microbacterium thalassium TaxID=362649 RepID=A0A7X0FSJ7_9MICO|nr:GNAT family N-acetyltransferase [Microbacterium thalassium]MBB6392759.1 RimJ/RimL family protein N-acetyltransferase [Microbacterium thalassium]
MEMDRIWPLFGLRLRTPRLEMRPVRDEDFPGLVDAAVAGIHAPDRMPFLTPWSEAEPDALARSMVQFQWGLRVGLTAEKWTVSFAVLRDGVPIGVRDVQGVQFAERRTVESGSWLTQEHQGQGLGTEMRAGMLMFAFDHLGAEWAESSAAEWNDRSLGVSRKLGYELNGRTRMRPRPGESGEEVRVRLSAAQFRRPAWDLVAEGVEPAKAQLLPEA